MRISDWSSDVCSSDLRDIAGQRDTQAWRLFAGWRGTRRDVHDAAYDGRDQGKRHAPESAGRLRAGWRSVGGGGLVATADIVPRELAAVFFANGDGFLPSDAADNRIDGREVCYGTTIAAELVLKAYLITKGWRDASCSRAIRQHRHQD